MKLILEQQDLQEMARNNGQVIVRVAAYWNDVDLDNSVIAIGKGSIHLEYIGNMKEEVLRLMSEKPL